MAPIYAVPQLLVATTDPLSQSPEWLDITQWAMQVDTAYGRQHELQQVEAQTIKAQMDDRTGLFSSWNALSPFNNLMSYQDSTLSGGGLGTWQAGANTSIVVVGHGFDGGTSLQLSPIGGPQTIAAGTESMTWNSVAVAPVTPGKVYNGFVSLRSQSAARACQVGIIWRTSSGGVISTSLSGTTNDSSTGYTKVSVNGTAPANAAWGLLVIIVASANEPHLAARFGITQRYKDISSGYILDSLAWGPGGYGLAPGRPLQLSGSVSGTPYSVAYAYLENNVPKLSDELNKEATLTCADALKYFANETIDTSLYPGFVLSDGATCYWRFNDPGNSTILKDSSFNGNMGLVSGAWKTTTPLMVDDSGYSITSPFTTSYLGASIGPGNDGLAFPAVPASSPGFSAEMIYNSTTAPNGAYTQANSLIIGSGPNTALGITINGDGTVEVYDGALHHITGPNICDGQNHHIVVTYNNATGSLSLYVDYTLGLGTSFSSTIAGTSGSFASGNFTGRPLLLGGWGQTYDEVSVYPSVLSATQVSNHAVLSSNNGWATPAAGYDSGSMIELFLLAAGFPKAMLSIENGEQQVQLSSIPSLGVTTLMSVLQQITATEQGIFYQNHSGVIVFLNRYYAIQAAASITVQATFENAPSSQNLYLPDGFEPTLDDLDVWNDTPVQSKDMTGPVTTLNSDSIDHFGRRSLQGYSAMQFAGSVGTQTNAATSLSQWLNSLYSIPFTRIRQANLSSAANSGSGLVQMLSRDILDLVAFIYHPQDAGSSFNQAAQIEKITHSVKPFLWDTGWQLTPYVWGSRTWLTLDDATLGRLDTVAAGGGGNQLAY